MVQTQMTGFVKGNKERVDQGALSRAIYNMIVKDYLMFSILYLMNIVSPSYNVPSRNTKRSRIEKLYEDQK